MRTLKQIDKDIAFVTEDYNKCLAMGSWSGMSMCKADLRELRQERWAVEMEIKKRGEFATKNPIEKYFEKIYAEIDKRYENLI